MVNVMLNDGRNLVATVNDKVNVVANLQSKEICITHEDGFGHSVLCDGIMNEGDLMSVTSKLGVTYKEGITELASIIYK